MRGLTFSMKQSFLFRQEKCSRRVSGPTKIGTILLRLTTSKTRAHFVTLKPHKFWEIFHMLLVAYKSAGQIKITQNNLLFKTDLLDKE